MIASHEKKSSNLDPFIGPTSFSNNIDDQKRFFGRDYESNEIVSLILGHKLCLIYAQSGAGKTSIFNAKVTPILEKYKFEVLHPTRVGIASDSIMTFNKKSDISFKDSSGNKKKSINFYMYNALKRLKPEVNGDKLLEKRLMHFLSDYFPLNKENTDTASKKAQVLAFDQLEEIFNFYPGGTWREQQEDFFEQISEALEQLSYLRIVFIIREDYLAELDRFIEFLPERLRPRFRLERLKKQAAKSAIKGPLELVKERLKDYSEEKLNSQIDKLVEELLKISVENPVTGEPEFMTGQFIEPIQLQVVCQRWWNDIKYGKEQNTFADFKSVDVDKALIEFYEDALVKVVKQTNLKEDIIRRFFEEKLITSSDTRAFVHVKAFKQFFTSDNRLVKDKDIDIFFDIFKDSFHLIRREWRSGAQWYELTHDRFIGPLKKSNKNWYDQKTKLIRSLTRKRVIVPILIIVILGISIFSFFIYNSHHGLENQKNIILSQSNLINQGFILSSLGKYNASIALFDKALAIDPNNTAALNGKGNALSSLGKYNASIALFDKELAINSTDTHALYNKGNALSSLGKYNASIALFDKALAIDPKYTDALYNKGNALSSLGKYNASIALFDKALAINSTDTHALYNKGNALSSLGKYNASIALYDKALAINSTDTIALNDIGLVLFDNLGNYTGAVGYFDKALTITPNDTNLINNKALTNYYLNNYSGSIQNLDNSLKINATDDISLANKGMILDKLGYNTEALPYFDKVIKSKYFDNLLKIDPNDTFALQGKGELLAGMGNYTESIKYFDKFLSKTPVNIEIFHDKARSLFKSGNYAKAVHYFDKILSINPNDTIALDNKQLAQQVLQNKNMINNIRGIK
jgi:tetratricopeptide (TPR) repeat protein